MSQRSFRNRHVWTFSETKAFLAAYSARKSEFYHSRKKKFAMANVLKDLIGQNVLSEPTTVEALQNKLKNLMRAYKTAKNSNSSTGSTPDTVPFKEELEEIFGNQPNISNVISLNLRGRQIAPLEVITTSQSRLAQSNPPQSSSSSVLPILLPCPQPASPSSQPSPHSPSPSTSQFRSSPTPKSHLSPTPSTSSPSPQLPSTSKKRKSPRAEWYSEKIKHLKRKEEILQSHMEKIEKGKEERFTQLVEQRQRHHEEKMQLLRQLINKRK